jgi:hypothetical protein
MSDNAAPSPAAPEQTTVANPAPPAAPPTTWNQHTQRFFSRSEMCLQLWPDPTTARGRNTLGLWLVGAPLVVLLLLKAMFGWPRGLMGWAWILILAAAFAMLGAGFMEWGLSPEGDAAGVPRESWIYMGIGGGVLVFITLMNLGVALGRSMGGRKNGGGPTMVVANQD